MTPAEICREAEKRGLRIKPAGDKLAVTPKGVCPPDFAEVLKQHKPELLDWLNRPPCPGWQAVPPDDLPFNSCPPQLPVPDARRVMSFITRQLTGTDALCEWCLCRESAYWNEFHWPDDVCALAAAIDAICFQLGRSQADALEVLAGFEEGA